MSVPLPPLHRKLFSLVAWLVRRTYTLNWSNGVKSLVSRLAGRTDQRESLSVDFSICNDTFYSVKAVANGALAWHIDATVSSRVSKFHYGIMIGTPFDEKNKEHQGRPVYYHLSNGVAHVSDMWSSIVEKVSPGVADSLGQ